MRSRFLMAAALIVLAAPLRAADPPTAQAPPPAPDTETQISIEVRVLTVADTAFERAGIELDPKTGVLTDAQLRALLEAVQSDRSASVMQCPKVTLDDGQETTVRSTQRQFFVTGLDVTQVNGSPAFIPRNVPLDTGVTLTLSGRTSADKKAVVTGVKYTKTEVVGDVPLVPVITQMTPTLKDGTKGKPIPFTQYLQVPQVETFTIEKADLTLPSGGHAIIPGPATTVEARNEFGPPVLSKIPYLNRMFKNVGIARTTVRTYLIVTPRVLEVPAEPAAQR